jgi:hypothetical protein
MSHLNEIGMNYFQHLYRAWRWAFMLIVHGILPNVWKDKVSTEMCVDREVDNATRAYMLKTMYNIVEKKETPSVWDRLSDREVQAMILHNDVKRAEAAAKVKMIKPNTKKNK